MAVKYTLTPELRTRLKQPLGILIKGTFAETMKRLKTVIADETQPTIISVGDTVTSNLIKNGFTPKLMIIDNKCMRRTTRPIKLQTDNIMHTANPQGTITGEAEAAIKTSLQSGQQTKIIVDGEEDLLTLTAIMHAPENSFIIYGQPHEGIVVVNATPEKKREITSILNSMEKASKHR